MLLAPPSPRSRLLPGLAPLSSLASLLATPSPSSFPRLELLDRDRVDLRELRERVGEDGDVRDGHRDDDPLGRVGRHDEVAVADAADDAEELRLREENRIAHQEELQDYLENIGSRMHNEDLEGDIGRCWSALRRSCAEINSSKVPVDLVMSHLRTILEELYGVVPEGYQDEAKVTSFIAGLFLTHRGFASISQDAPLMNSINMPATVVAEALGHVQASLGKPIGTQPLTSKQQKADAIANAIPITEQGRELQATEQVGKARPSDWKIVTPDLPLLDKALNEEFETQVINFKNQID